MIHGNTLPGECLHACEFQRNMPSNYQVIVILTKRNPFRFERGTCIRGHQDTSGMLERRNGTTLHNLLIYTCLRTKKTATESVQWLRRYEDWKSVTTAGRPTALTRNVLLLYEGLHSLVIASTSDKPFHLYRSLLTLLVPDVSTDLVDSHSTDSLSSAVTTSSEPC